MKLRAGLLALAVLACGVSAPAQEKPTATPTATPAATPAAVAFVNVNVIPMDRERVLEDQTVVVRGGRIAEVGPAARVKVPAGAVRVDARGKYLMPGLAEMHGHLPHPQMPEAVQRGFLTLFVANGVTTVRGMFGFPTHVALRDRVAKGELLGPRLYVASPPIMGQTAPDPETAARLVREHKAAGFDLLKIHEGLSLASYDAMVKTAREVGIRFGGHVPDDVGLAHALETGMSSVEHMDGFVEALEADDSPIRNADPQTRGAQLHLYLDEKKLPAE